MLQIWTLEKTEFFGNGRRFLALELPIARGEVSYSMRATNDEPFGVLPWIVILVTVIVLLIGYIAAATH